VPAQGDPGPASNPPGSATSPADLASSPSLAVWDFLRGKYDRNGDARIERVEYPRGERAFGYVDADHDGVITTADFAGEWGDGPRDEGFTWGEGGPEPGDPAPELRLLTTGGEPVGLSAFRGKKPVALVFGSFT